jgi:gamma-glutamyltranspeptidase/glutathione hydrolase/leukotriene-C4 hydrolase
VDFHIGFHHVLLNQIFWGKTRPILSFFLNRPSKKVMLMAAAAVGFICAVGLALALTFVSAGVDPDAPFAPPSPSRLGKFKTAAVSSDGTPCSTIGR